MEIHRTNLIKHKYFLVKTQLKQKSDTRMTNKIYISSIAIW